MKKMCKAGLMMLALTLALSLGMAAMAEGTTETVPEVPAAEAATDAAQAKADALNEALKAYSNAKTESRKQAYLDSLKKDLDDLVAAGKLTQEQADLIVEYYTEQMTLMQNNGRGFGRGGMGGKNRQDGMGMNRNGFDQGGRRGRFNNNNTAPAESNAPGAPAEQSGI